MTRSHVGVWLGTELSDIRTLLCGLAGTAYNGATGEPSQNDFSTASHDTLVTIASLSAVRRAVRKMFGKLRPTQYPVDASEAKDPQRAVAEQFAWLDAQQTAAAKVQGE